MKSSLLIILILSSINAYADKSKIKPKLISPEIKIPGFLMSQVIITDSGKEAPVQIRVLKNVYNPKTHTIIISKNSIIDGHTTLFNKKTGRLIFTLEKVTTPTGKSFSHAFEVGSGDGNRGLASKVYDSDGKYLSGSFITVFSGKSLKWFSKNINKFVAKSNGKIPVIDEKDNIKIFESLYDDLKNAKQVYFVKKGVPLVLFPTATLK